MKNIGMKKNINEQREGIWGKNLKSLKSLKSLMQIFAESANSAKQIFATFATFAMQIFSNLVNMVKTVKTVMQIFAKGEYSAVRVSSVQRPTNIQRISNLSPTVSTVKVAQKSRIRPMRYAFAMVVMMVLGVNMNVWGRTSSINTPALWVSSTDVDADSVAWSASDVTFKLHNGGNIELDANDHILIQKGYTYKLEWRVANGKTINVTGVSVRVRSTMNKSYMTVGSVTSGNVGPEVGIGVYTTVSSGTLSLGNNGYVSLRPESGNGSAIFHMDEITVTYTMDGVDQEVTFDSWNDYDHSKTATTNGPFTKYPEDGTTFTMGGDFKRYTKKNDETDTHFFLEKTTTGWFAETHIGTLSWTQPTGYTIAVEGIVINTFSSGKLYIWPNDDTGKEIRIIDNYTNTAGQTVPYVYNLTYTYSNNSTGYLFPGGNKMGVSDQFKFKATSNEVKINTLTVKYTLTPNTYSITLNNESPTTEGSTSVTVTYDSNNQLSITNPAKDGYTLDGWYTNETDGNGSGTKVIDANGFLQANVDGYTGANGVWKKAANNTNLYAQWNLNSDKTITLNNQGATTAGTESMTVRFMTNNYSTGSTSISVPEKDYYHFAGYYSESSGGVQVIDEDGNIVAGVEGYTDYDTRWINSGDDDETTLYAHWTGISYSVRFNANTGSGSMSNQDFVYGTAQNLTLNDFEKTCMVTYDANGGSCGIASSETPFSFLGWAASEEGAAVYSDGASVNNLTTTSGATVDLYAKWAATPSEVELPMPTKDNSVFTGWYNAGEELVGVAGDTYTPSGNETLYAHWKPGVSMTISNLSGGDLVVTTEHVRFTLHSDGYNITDYKDGYGFYVWEPLPKNTTKDVTLSWEKTIENGSYSIHVTNISFKAKAYNSDAFIVSKGKISFNGGDAFSIGTAKLTTDGGWSSTIGGEGDYESGVVIQLINTSGVAWETFDYHFKDFQIEYTITPNAPTADDTDLAATLDLKDKQKVAVSSLFSLTNPADDFTYSYRLKEDYANAYLEDGNFWATAGGDYEVQACVASGEDHEASVWSTSTIHVTRTCIFNNNSTDKDWETVSNWEHNVQPAAIDAVRVQGNLIVDKEIEVMSMSIEDDAVVHIAPNGGLTVGAGGITGATKDNLKLQAGTEGATKGQTGYLRISPEYTGAMPEATVEMYSIGYYNKAAAAENSAAWQLVGSPVDFGSRLAKTVYTRSWIYSYDESTDSWYNERSSLVMQPFKGYKTTQYDSNEGKLMTYTGNLYPVNKTPEDKVYDIDLEYTEGYGHNVVANSFSAPIDITQFEVSDFENAEKTIYIYNTGNRAQRIAAGGDLNGNSAGQWTAISIGTIEEMTTYFSENPGVYSTIAPMQGFCVNATGSDAKLKLDYTKLVWNADYSAHSPKPMRSPRRIASQEEPITGTMKIAVEADGWSDEVFMLESERYDEIYEDGFDAHKLMSGEMNIFIIREGEKLAIDATNSIIGTRVGVRTGEETAYTMTFSHVNSDDDLTLWDIEAEEKIEISEGQTYTFFAEPNSEITGRFVIVEAEAPEIATGFGNDGLMNDEMVKAKKFVKDDQLYILKNGVLYDATGKRVQ